MDRRMAILALLALVVMAGCFTSLGTDDDTSPSETPGVNNTTDVDSAPTNPWGKETLTVSVDQPSDSWRNITPLVAETIAYWEPRDEDYGSYQIDFDLRPNASEPDVRVRYVEDITECGSPNRDGGAGFAPVITNATPPEPPETICVRQGYTDDSTHHILKHEFGHLLGIGHGQPPEQLMSTDYEYVQIPRPGSAVRSMAPTGESVTIYADRSEIFARRDYVAQRQLEHVIEYFERKPGLVGESTLNITMAADEEQADVVLTFPSQSPCNNDLSGSCAVLETGVDGTSRLRAHITTTHEDTYGWHAGFWLAIALGAATHEELPAPFRNATIDDRHSNWWEGDE